jgi:hypothetical protein
VNLLDAKIIQTKYEKEIFLDQNSNIVLNGFNYPERNFPFYTMMVGLELIRIRGNEFYGSEKRYFGMIISEDFQSITIIEPDQQSIFAGKNVQEKQAVIELIEYVLTESPNFKKLVTTTIQNIKQSNVVFEREIRELKAKLTILEGLLNVRFEDVTFAIQKKITA